MTRADSLRLQPAHPPETGMAYAVLGNVLKILRAWHDEEHPGAFRMCQVEPCKAIQDDVDWLDDDGTGHSAEAFGVSFEVPC